MNTEIARNRPRETTQRVHPLPEKLHAFCRSKNPAELAKIAARAKIGVPHLRHCALGNNRLSPAAAARLVEAAGGELTLYDALPYLKELQEANNG